jgi:hypothetical protein
VNTALETLAAVYSINALDDLEIRLVEHCAVRNMSKEHAFELAF